MNKHSNETYELAQILTLITEAKIRAEVLTNSPNIGGIAKHFIKTHILNRINAIAGDILAKLPPHDKDIMKADVLDEETALQLHAIKNGVLALSRDGRDKVEAFAEELLQEELSSTQNAAA